MIEVMGLLYGISKVIADSLKWTEDEKYVELQWLEKAGLKEQANAEGLDLVWSKGKKVETRLLKGYEIFYELDNENRILHKIVVTDSNGDIDLVLMAKPK